MLCAVNSIALCCISLVLYVCEFIPVMFIGWLIAIFYYFINKHILLQVNQNSCKRKKSIISIIVVLFILLSVFIGGDILSNSILDIDNSSNYYTDIEGQVYNLEGYNNCAIVRTITLSDGFTAEFVYALMDDAYDEMEIIHILNAHGAEQGGGKGHLVEPGYWVDEVDEWCFDPNRKEGDMAIIENDYGYTICYISAIFE